MTLDDDTKNWLQAEFKGVRRDIDSVKEHVDTKYDVIAGQVRVEIEGLRHQVQNDHENLTEKVDKGFERLDRESRRHFAEADELREKIDSQINQVKTEQGNLKVALTEIRTTLENAKGVTAFIASCFGALPILVKALYYAIKEHVNS